MGKRFNMNDQRQNILMHTDWGLAYDYVDPEKRIKRKTIRQKCFARRIKKDSLGKVSRYLPSMLDYRNHIDKLSMYNTPPVFSIFVMNETLKWLKGIGGIDAIHAIDVRKAETLYAEIDRNSLFVGTAAKEDRSIMNICFVMAPGREDLQDEFLKFATERDIVGIKGHRSVGGFRASVYNACTQEDVEALVAVMQEFEKLHA